MNAETVVVAFIGASQIMHEHLHAFCDIPNVSVAGIHSRTRTKAVQLAETFGIQGVYDSVEELYKATEADLVVVAVSELSANAVSQACFQFPWTVLLEKPAGYTVADAEAIYAAAKAKRRQAYVALNRRFLSSTQAVLADLQEQQGPRFIKVQDQQDQARALQAGQPQAVVENWMYANSIHMVDYLRLFGRGQIVKVNPIIAWDPKQPWIMVVEVHFASGDIGLYEGIWHGPGPWAVSINTPEKRWEMRPLEQAGYQLPGRYKLEMVEVHPWDKTFKPGLRLQAELAVAAAQGNTTPLPTLAEALETMRLIQAIFER